MAFRFEQKILISGSNSLLFKSWVIDNGGTKIHDDRTVTSIYFDNSALDLYTLSNEGSVPRKKIRLRCYDELNKIGELNRYEIKISAAEGRYKEISKIENSNSILKYGILDKDYGICKPVVIVSYVRSYYKLFELRITIDKNIIYRKYNINIYKTSYAKERNIIAEIKSDNINYANEIKNNCPFNFTRFSKYCRAIEHLFTNKVIRV